MPPKLRRVELTTSEVLVYKGMEIDREILNAVVSTDRRLLWAFVRSEDGLSVRAVPYSEEQCVWFGEADVTPEREVEI
jgi:hypothetical protein